MLNLGDGANVVSVTAGQVGKNARFDLEVNGGAASDTIDLVFAELSANARLKLDGRLEAGADDFNLTLNGTLDLRARVDVKLRGGLDNDTAALVLADASFLSRVRAQIAGDVESVTGFSS